MTPRRHKGQSGCDDLSDLQAAFEILNAGVSGKIGQTENEDEPEKNFDDLGCGFQSALLCRSRHSERRCGRRRNQNGWRRD